MQFRSLPSSLLWVYLLKDFRRLNLRLTLIFHYCEQRRHMNNACSSYFIVIYDQLFHFLGINCLLTEYSQNQEYLLSGAQVGA